MGTHRTIMDGTVYEIKGGKTLIDGTAYSIDKGKTLIDGTAYEVGFAEMVTITLTGTTYAYVEYNGTQYKAPATFEVAVGDQIYLQTNPAPRGGYIYLNGTQVATGSGSAQYSYTVTCDATIETKQNNSGANTSCSMYITEQ